MKRFLPALTGLFLWLAAPAAQAVTYTSYSDATTMTLSCGDTFAGQEEGGSGWAKAALCDILHFGSASLYTLDSFPSGTDSVRFASADEDKLDGIEAGADVTDAANVAAAGAFMKASDDLDDISGVDLTGVASGDLLQWNGSDWVVKNSYEAFVGTGTNSLTIGQNGVATHLNNTAYGFGARGTADYATAVGSGATADQLRCTALGVASNCDMTYQLDIGHSTVVSFYPTGLIDLDLAPEASIYYSSANDDFRFCKGTGDCDYIMDPAAATLDTLSGVSVSGASDGDVLFKSSTGWIAKPLAFAEIDAVPTFFESFVVSGQDDVTGANINLTGNGNVALTTDAGNNEVIFGVTDEYCVALSDYTNDLTTGTGVGTLFLPAAATVTGVRAWVNTAPVGSTIVVDINEAGTSIMSTNKLSIDASEKTSGTAATAAGVTDTALAANAEITFDIDQIGSSTAGKGLVACLEVSF